MPQAIDEAGNVWEVDAHGNPVSFVRSGGARGPAPMTFGKPRPADPLEVAQKNAGVVRTQTQTAGDVIANRQKAQEITQRPISDKDQALINSMRLNNGDLPAVIRDITGAARAVDTFQPAPGKGTQFSWYVPEDNDWPVTAWAKNTLADVMGVPKAQREAYQTLTSLQNQAVLNAQVMQKGPQTESDAARMKLAGISPNKDVRPNAILLAEQNYDAHMKQARPSFYATWANRLGSTHALNREGKTADQVWSEKYAEGLKDLRSRPKYRSLLPGGIFGRRPAPKAASSDDDLINKYAGGR